MNLNGKSKITWWRSGMRTQGREDLGTRNGVTQKLGRVSAWDVGFQNLLLGEDSEEGLYKTEKCLSVSHVLLFATPWTAAHEASLAMDVSRQEYWNGLPFPSPGNLPNPGIEPCLLRLLHLQADSLPSEPPGKPQARGTLRLWSWEGGMRPWWRDRLKPFTPSRAWTTLNRYGW